VQRFAGVIQKHLHQLAAPELPKRIIELAEAHGIQVLCVSVRNQKSRWGSCSRHGTISLNWRLIQTPAFVRDYIILHKLAHRKQMNHSSKLWQEVERFCPAYLEAEKWLKQNANLNKVSAISGENGLLWPRHLKSSTVKLSPISKPVTDIIAYHERTKHQPERYARGPHGLDWATQPNPFRRFTGAPRSGWR